MILKIIPPSKKGYAKLKRVFFQFRNSFTIKIRKITGKWYKNNIFVISK